MATILKSNTAVNNPNREFQYYTKRGITDKALSDFLSGMDAARYELTDIEYNAVKAFKENLDAAGVWDKVYEVYPMMGNSVASAGVKLKSLTKSTMTPISGLNDSHLQFSGGKVIGKAAAVTPNYQANFPRYDTNLKYSDVPDRYVGFHVYCGNAPTGDTHVNLPVIGALFGKNSELSQYVGRMTINPFASRYDGRYLTAGLNVVTGFNASMGLVSVLSKPQVYGVSAVTSIYRAGVKLGTSGAILLDNESNIDTSTTFGFLGQNISSTSTSGATTGYSGAVRFGCITSGTLTDAEVITLNAEIVSLLNKLGKAA